MNLASPCAALTGCVKGTNLDVSIDLVKNSPFKIDIPETVQIYSSTVEDWKIDKGLSDAVNVMF
jgi:hypothetical protein